MEVQINVSFDNPDKNKAHKTQVQDVVYSGYGQRIAVSKDKGETWQEVIATYSAMEGKIIFNSNCTIVILDGKYKGIAKCHPTDTFDPQFSVRLAYLRAMEQKLIASLSE